MEKRQVVLGAVVSGAAFALIGWAGSVEQHHATTGVMPRLDAIQEVPRTFAAVEIAQAPRDAAPIVLWRNGLLTLDVRDMRLGELLTEIGRQTGIAFDLADARDERVTFEANAEPLEQAIAALLDKVSYGYAYVDGAGPAGTRRILLVRRGSQATGPSVRSAAATVQPAPAAPSADDPALQQQRLTDSLFEACKASACDAS